MLNGKKVVLVVEDEPFHNEDICTRLSRMGYVTIACYDLREIWDKIWAAVGAVSAIDLVIQDGEVDRFYHKKDRSVFQAERKIFCTLEFIRDLRKDGYAGPIMANSVSGFNNAMMMENGATHEVGLVAARPWDAADKILRGEA